MAGEREYRAESLEECILGEQKEALEYQGKDTHLVVLVIGPFLSFEPQL